MALSIILEDRKQFILCAPPRPQKELPCRPAQAEFRGAEVLVWYCMVIRRESQWMGVFQLVPAVFIFLSLHFTFCCGPHSMYLHLSLNAQCQQHIPRSPVFYTCVLSFHWFNMLTFYLHEKNFLKSRGPLSSLEKIGLERHFTRILISMSCEFSVFETSPN